jgi:hypothetical protein
MTDDVGHEMIRNTKDVVRSVMWATVASLVPAIVFLMAIGKLAAWREFEESLMTYSILPIWLLRHGAPLVPAVESIPLVMCVSGRPLMGNFSSLLLLSSLTALTLVQWILLEPPECACLGVWAQYVGAGESARAVVFRNFVLVIISLIACARGARCYLRLRDRSTP